MEGNYLDRNTHRDEWGTSWPARTYNCSFCNREFKSAQALGGHMNIHRRDRARLRSLSSLPSLVSECPKTNPTNDSNQTLLSPPPNLSDEILNYAQPSPIYSTCDLYLSSPPSPPGSTCEDKIFHQFPLLSSQSEEIMVINNTRSGFDVGEMKGNAAEEENITLELGLGLLKQPEEKLDLELRLGYF